MSVKENNKYDETIIHKQSADLYSIHEDQLLFEEANPQKQHLKGHSRADESSKASVDSQVVQIKLEGLNVKSNSESDNEDTISVSTVNLSGEINVSMPSSFQLYATEHMGSFYEGIVQEFFFMVDVTLHCFAICPHHTVHLNMEPHISNEGVC